MKTRRWLGGMVVLLALTACAGEQAVDETSYKDGYAYIGTLGATLSVKDRESAEASCKNSLPSYELANPEPGRVAADWIAGCTDAALAHEARF
ncbi:hypothetical protein ACFVFI_18915 [Streptomyces sp. NPDC057705]|uniref:hypothetical protein n=1 Tax=Streptomyces sp. NPDC057705 TaxID=3346222 RepID=UPI003691BBB3